MLINSSPYFSSVQITTKLVKDLSGSTCRPYSCFTATVRFGLYIVQCLCSNTITSICCRFAANLYVVQQSEAMEFEHYNAVTNCNLCNGLFSDHVCTGADGKTFARITMTAPPNDMRKPPGHTHRAARIAPGKRIQPSPVAAQHRDTTCGR